MMKTSCFMAALVAAVALATTSTRAATVNVSGEGDTLQAAITAAQAGDTLLVAPGTYSPITSSNKAITIESTGGAEVTIIDGGGTNRCATLGAGNIQHTNTVLTGFTLWNGYAGANDSGGGSSCGLKQLRVVGQQGKCRRRLLLRCTEQLHSDEQHGIRRLWWRRGGRGARRYAERMYVVR